MARLLALLSEPFTVSLICLSFPSGPGALQRKRQVVGPRCSMFMALRRTEDGIDGAWQTPVGGKAATNLASVDFGGGITLGVSRDDGVLRIWLAPRLWA